MSQNYGIQPPAPHVGGEHRPAARYLVLIDAGGVTVARLALASFEAVAEFDAGAEEVAVMTRGLHPVRGASGSEWDRALEGHSAAERAAAEVYTLDV
ncbi:MAG: hypothetical protein MUE62_09190 [Burkholderiaceae bacterium]|jgi:hypothetical protein|nr:hypothetical protein [Burkholderiaceae bacterium]